MLQNGRVTAFTVSELIKEKQQEGVWGKINPPSSPTQIRVKDFFSKSEQISRKLRNWSHLLKKCLMENFIFCALYSR